MMLSDSASKFIHDGLCAAFGVTDAMTDHTDEPRTQGEPMTTTQTQVTGPVDDAIDAELDRIEELAMIYTDYGLNDTEMKERKELRASITARLAPRADALIEREQVERAVELGFDEWDWEHPDGQPPIQEVIGSVTDAVMALLPRAPMGDVVTISREDAILIRDELRENYNQTDWNSFVQPAENSPYTRLEELLTALEATP